VFHGKFAGVVDVLYTPSTVWLREFDIDAANSEKNAEGRGKGMRRAYAHW